MGLDYRYLKFNGLKKNEYLLLIALTCAETLCSTRAWIRLYAYSYLCMYRTYLYDCTILLFLKMYEMYKKIQQVCRYNFVCEFVCVRFLNKSS